MLRKNAIYTMYQYLCPPLSIYIYTVACREGEGGGGWGLGDVERCYTPFHFSEPYQIYAKIFSEKFPNCHSFGQSRLTSSCHFFLPDSSILCQCKGILSSKQNHKFKHTKAASTKPLARIKFIFSNPPPLFWHRHTTVYICIYSITQVKYLQFV